MTFNRNNTNQQDYQPEFSEKVVDIKRVAKVVKGGRNLSFRTLVVIGNGKGKVGVGLGKSEAIPDAVQKATSVAQKNLVSFDLKESIICFFLSFSLFLSFIYKNAGILKIKNHTPIRTFVFLTPIGSKVRISVNK